MKVVKAAAQVLNTLWQYRELRNLYKQVRTCTTSGLWFTFPCLQRAPTRKSDRRKLDLFAVRWLFTEAFVQDGWNYTHFVTPVSTLERDRYLSQPTLPTSPMRTSPVIVSGDSISSGCPILRLKETELLCRPVFFLRGQRHVLTSHAGLQETQF